MEIHTRAQAIELGLKRYFTGKPCSKGHIAARHMVGGCVVCKGIFKNAAKRRRRRDPDQVEARLRAAAVRRELAAVERARKEERKAAQRIAQKATAAAARAARSIELKAAAEERRRQRYLANREVRLARAKARYQVNKDRYREQAREYRLKNPEKCRARKRKRRAAKRAGVVEGLMRLQRGRCAYCRERLVPAITHIDHVMPLALGGPDHRKNLQLACADCNISKSAKDPIAFSQERGMLL